MRWCWREGFLTGGLLAFDTAACGEVGCASLNFARSDHAGITEIGAVEWRCYYLFGFGYGCFGRLDWKLLLCAWGEGL